MAPLKVESRKSRLTCIMVSISKANRLHRHERKYVDIDAVPTTEERRHNLTELLPLSQVEAPLGLG